MTRKWDKIEDGRYAFTLDNIKVGEMKFSNLSLENIASCIIGEESFVIKRTGFWKSTVELESIDGKVLAKTYNEKWYANSSVLEYGGKKYKLLLHNNPLAELAIIEEKPTILSYGLYTDKEKICIRISGDTANENLIFDFLLWYLFVPIATENVGDNFVFQLLLPAQ